MSEPAGMPWVPMRVASRRPHRLAQPADDPDRLVSVEAGELWEWAWLVAELADWLHHAADTTRLDLPHRFGGLCGPEHSTYFLIQVGKRIAALLDAGGVLSAGGATKVTHRPET